MLVSGLPIAACASRSFAAVILAARYCGRTRAAAKPATRHLVRDP